MRTASSNPGVKLLDALLHPNWWEWWDEIVTFLIWVTFSKSKRQKKLRVYFVLLFLSLLATSINSLLAMKVFRLVLRTKVTTYQAPVSPSGRKNVRHKRQSRSLHLDIQDFPANSPDASTKLSSLIITSPWCLMAPAQVWPDSTSHWLNMRNQKTGGSQSWETY